MHGKAVTIADILPFVENWTDRPLVDQTGVAGLFKVNTRGWMDAPPGQEPPPGAKTEYGGSAADAQTVFGMFESIGLKLESRKLPVEIFVIDHIERPSEN